MPQASDINLQKGMTLLQQGNIFYALKEFHQLKFHLTSLSATDQELLLKKYNLALNILLDRYIASAQESMESKDDINTILILFTILNFYSDLRFTVNKHVNYDSKIIEGLAYDYEKWVLRVLDAIKHEKFKLKKIKDSYNEVFTTYSNATITYQQVILSLLKDLASDSKYSAKIQKNISDIGKNFIEFFVELGEYFIKYNNLIRSKEILAQLTKIYEFIDKPQKYHKALLDYQSKVIELAADCEMEAGNNYREHQNYETSIQHYKIAYVQYRDLNIENKQKKAKDEYLNSCILSAKHDLEKAQQFSERNENEDALYHYQLAIDKLRKINATKVLNQAESLLHSHYEQKGNKKLAASRKFINQNIEELRTAENLLEEAKDFYYKANNKKKEIECEKELIKLQKTRFKLLTSKQQEYQAQNDYERELLTLEELHYLCYKMDDTTYSKKFARRMEKLKENVNFQVLDQLKSEVLKEKPWLNPKDTTIKGEAVTQLLYSKKEQKNTELPNIFTTPLPDTTAFFDLSNEQTYIGKTKEDSQLKIIYKKLNAPAGLSQNKVVSNQDLQQIYQIIKKFNSRQYLLNHEVQFLLAYSINLPQDGSYYFKFPQSKHNFYVQSSQTGIPLVLMVPTTLMVKKKDSLGALALKVDIFIPINQEEQKQNFHTTDILKSHLLLAINHPQWARIIEGFQYSTLDHYFYFLHAIRLFTKQAPNGDISRYLNSSVIAEMMDMKTDDLERYLNDFQNVHYIEQINLWSKNNNFRLFFSGLLYLRNKNFNMASFLWNMMEIS